MKKGPDGIYLADEPLGGSDAAQGLARLNWPRQLPHQPSSARVRKNINDRISHASVRRTQY